MTKLNPEGTALVYSTYLRGENDDFGFCGRPKTSARGSYCEQHSQGAFRRLGSSQAVEAWALKGVKEKRVQPRLV